MTTTTIRLPRQTHEKLKEIADKERTSLGAMVDRLIAQYEEQAFRRAVHESFRGLREDPAEWEAYQDMIRPWDATLLDGLENESEFEGVDGE